MTKLSQLNHLNAAGEAHMVEIKEKQETIRQAVASGRIVMSPETWQMVKDGNSKKGDVLGVARVAAIQASKHTSKLIPLCHPLSITSVGVEFNLQASDNHYWVECLARVCCIGRTGVEMEALTAVSVGLMTVYDMLKAVQKDMVIKEIRLLEKSGGRSGRWQANNLTT